MLSEQRGMLPRAVSDRDYDASRELDSILPKVYDIYKAYMCRLNWELFRKLLLPLYMSREVSQY